MSRRADCVVLRGSVGGHRGRGMAHWARGTGDRWKVKAANSARWSRGRRWRRRRRAGGGSSRSGLRCGKMAQ